jgi:hypothetical protein
VLAGISVDTGNVLRVLALAEGGIIVGAMLACYHRIWRFAVPPIPSRLALISGAGVVILVMIGVWDHLDTPLTWRAPLVLTFFSMHALGLFGIYRWSMRPEGERIRHKMRAEQIARTLPVTRDGE